MDWLDGLDTDTLLRTMEKELQNELPGFSIRQLFEKLLNGENGLDIATLLQQAADVIWNSATAQLDLLGQLVLLAVAFAVLRQMESSFSSGNIQKVSGMVVQAVAVLLILQSGQQVLEYVSDAVNRMTGIMTALLPVQLLLMTGLGNVKTAGLLQPSMLFTVQAAAWFFQKIILPLITMEFLLKLVNSFSDIYRLTGLASFLRKAVLTSISFFVMLFLAFLSLQGIGGQAMDHLALRTVKYITGNAVPVVGGMLSGLMDTFLSGGMVIRNVAGMTGLLVILILTVLPAMKILVLYFLYHFAAALLQPLGESPLTGLLEQTAGSFMLAFAVVALTGVLFFFMILIVLAASGTIL